MKTMNPVSNLDDLEIIDRILKGEPSFYELIVRRYNSYLYKIGRSYNFNHEDTEDLMQDTYVDAYKNLDKFQNKASFKTWLIRIMLNNCYRKKERPNNKNEVSKDQFNENAQAIFMNNNNETGKMVNRKELNSIIEQALSKIPEDYRMVFSLREITGLNVAETAQLLDISEVNVKVRLNRSKAMLRTQISIAFQGEYLYDFNLIYCDAMVNRVMSAIEKI
ncbi:MAG TPA: sigma-70 family RNA polymerase sigma factor [Edaphocola sp.]|nr:sigma-70 family RNA polymerase sigma factor [Edaphocola sp.]